MMKSVLATLFLVFTSILSFAQEPLDEFEDFDFDEMPIEEDRKEKGYIDIGAAMFLDHDYSALDLRPFRSRSFNISSMEVFPIAKGLINYNVGLNLGFEGYNFQKDLIMSNIGDSTTFSEDPVATTDSVDYIKSKLATTYLDIIMEFEFNPSKNGKGFKLAVGGKAGYMFHAYHKRKMRVEDPQRIQKVKLVDHFNLNRFRYGVYGRMSFSNIGLYTYYSLSNLFKKDKGPELTPISFGLTFNFQN